MKTLLTIFITTITLLGLVAGGAGYFLYTSTDSIGADITAAFPASLNNFQEGDIIEEEDINAIE